MHHSGVAAFDFEHLRAFELLEARMREVERDGDTGYAVGREPLCGQPEMRLESRARARRARAGSPRSVLRAAALDRDAELPEAQVEQTSHLATSAHSSAG